MDCQNFIVSLTFKEQVLQLHLLKHASQHKNLLLKDTSAYPSMKNEIKFKSQQPSDVHAYRVIYYDLRVINIYFEHPFFVKS